MSQIIRPVLPSGSTRYVAGSGIATMSDSSIALKPVIDEPSKPMPSSSAPSSSLVVIEKLFRCPSRSVNQSRTSSIPFSSTCLRTSFRAFGSDVARSLLSIWAISPPRLDSRLTLTSERYADPGVGRRGLHRLAFRQAAARGGRRGCRPRQADVLREPREPPGRGRVPPGRHRRTGGGEPRRTRLRRDRQLRRRDARRPFGSLGG